LGDFRGRNAKPTGLDVHHCNQGQVVLVVEDGGTGDTLQVLGACDVVYMRVGDDDMLDREIMPVENAENAGDVVAGIYNDGFERGLVAEDRAVALEGADGEDLVDHRSFQR
jgi:hypothetical protein